MYATYEFYKDTYGGAVSEEDFPRMVIKASAYLDYYTMGKVKMVSDSESVKVACCALVDKYFEIEFMSTAAQKNASDVASAGKKSESVGSYSVTYQTADELKAMEQNLKAELAEICRIYLAGTNLLYRGGCRDVCTSYCNGL